MGRPVPAGRREDFQKTGMSEHWKNSQALMADLRGGGGKVTLDSENWSPDGYWGHGPPFPTPQKRKSGDPFTIIMWFLITKKPHIFSPCSPLAVIYQTGQGPLSCIQVRLWSLPPGGRGLFTTSPGCLFHLPTKQWIFYPLLICFSARSLLGANMIVSVTDIKMFLQFLKFLVINVFFLFGRQTLLATTKMSESREKKINKSKITR